MQPMKITTHPGIGDISWIYSKLVNADTDFDLVIAEDEKTKRALPLTDLLPKVRSAEYGSMSDYLPLSKCENALFADYQAAESAGKRLFVSANNYLETGQRLEGYLPDLETDFHYPINTSADDQARAATLLPSNNVYFGIYTSSSEGARNWNGWSAHEWTDFIRRIKQAHPHVVFVLIGAGWDRDLSRELAQILISDRIYHVNLTGKTSLGVSIECLKRLSYFAGYASGMGILSNVLNMPQLMLYPNHLKKLMHAWPCPYTLANGQHHCMTWGRPVDAFKLIEHRLNDFLCIPITDDNLQLAAMGA